MFRINCFTLFDITQTNVLNRSKPDLALEYNVWVKKRNSQSNLDTILQVVNLRTQPEDISIPKKIEIRFDEFESFGFLIAQEEDELYPCWTFNFNVQNLSVFNDGETELGNLYKDCHSVPMILNKTEWNKLPNFLDVSPELKNIHFEIENE